MKIPEVGIGTLYISPRDTKRCIIDALNAGYRLIDTAASYHNEKEIGEAIKESHVPRSEIIITSKVWIQDSGYKNTIKAFYQTLENLQTDYLDIYLIHHPFGDYYGSWKAMEELYRQGKVKMIGVSNFTPDRFVDLYMNVAIKPMINQIEVHPFFIQDETIHILKKYNCLVQAWGPLNEGQRDIFKNEVLLTIARKYNKSVAQVILRWHKQRDVYTIPKTIHKERMIENLDIYDFKLDEKDMETINKLDIGHSEIIDHRCYKTAKWLNLYKIHE